MYLLNTSYGWNLGDDLIREGVINLLGLSGKSLVFINRAQTRPEGKIVPVWKALANMSSPEELCRNATAFVMAGTPEWIDFTEDFYRAALKYKVPIYLVGVGLAPNNRHKELLGSCRSLIRGATTRDKFALQFLERLGVKAIRFPDPAFYANYPQSEKEFSLVVNYRAKGGNGTFYDTFDDYWRKVAKKYGPDIDLVTVHEMGEYERAKAIFDTPVFYSSEYRDYAEIYSKTFRYFGGRIHGATPVIACGGTAYVVYNSNKIEALSGVAKLGDSLKILTYKQELPEELLYHSAERMLQELETNRICQMDYWASRLP